MVARCVHDLVAECAASDPHRVALRWTDGQLSYGDLMARSAQVARLLQSVGIGRESPVGLLMSRSPQTVVAMLGVLQAGGAYVPLDPGDLEDRLEYMIADTGCELVLVDGESHDRLPESARARSVNLSAEWLRLAGLPTDPPPTPVSETNLVYVMYTSGSTGRPKGVQVTHAAVANLVRGDCARLDPGQVLCQLAPLAFDASTFEVWGPLCNGAQLVVAPPGPLGSREISDVVARHGVSVLWLTKGLFDLVVEAAPERLAGLGQLLTGGDVLSARHVRLALDLFPDTELCNAYGPTEATTFTTVLRGLGPDDTVTSVPVGRPISGVQVHILDGRLRPVPTGDIGELYVAGAGLARGYTDPLLTSERFVADPLSGIPGSRMYRTGDLARRRHDGVIEFVGRADDQIKVRGHRVEPREVETVLSRCSAVREVCCVPHPDASGERALAAYVVLDPATTVEDVRAHARKSLPHYMRPLWFVPLTQLPLSRNGKVDRAALPSPGVDDHRSTVASTGLESTVLAAWAELLDLPGLGPTDDFFELGGNSLLAGRATAKLRRLLGLEVPIGAIFEARTARALAGWIHEARQRGDRIAATGIGRRDRSEPAPLSPVQQQMWILHRLHPGARAYHFQSLLRFEGDLSVTALEDALNGVIERHEMFRTSFHDRSRDAGSPVQVVHRARRYDLPVLDLSALAPADRQEAFDTRLRDLLERPFDLSRRPLARWSLFRMAAGEHVLVHVEHHLIHDGWSFNVFLGDLCDLYRRAVQDADRLEVSDDRQGVGSVDPVDNSVDYTDFAAWHRELLDSGVRDRQLAYWRKRLADPGEPLDLPTDRPRPPVQTLRGTSLRVELPENLCGRLRAFSREHAVSLYMTLLAGFYVLLHRQTGREDLCVGSGLANRRWIETERMVGMLVNNLPLRVRARALDTFADLLREVRRVVLEAQENQDVPFHDIVAAVDVPRDPSRNPLFQVEFSFHDSPLPSLRLPGVVLSVVEAIPNGSAKFDLNVIAIPRREQAIGVREADHGEGITLIWEFSTDLFEQDTVRRLASDYTEILTACVTDPDVTVGRSATSVPVATSRPVPATDVAPEFAAPRERLTPTEIVVTTVWQELLGRAASPTDDFFTLGGDSWYAIRAAEIIRNRLGVDLSAGDILRYPTAREFARHIDGLAQAGDAAQAGDGDADHGPPVSGSRGRGLTAESLSDHELDALVRYLASGRGEERDVGGGG